MRYYFFFYTKYTASFELLSLQHIYNIFSSNTYAVIVPFLVHITHKTELLVFPLVQPAATPSEHNTTSDSIPKPPNSSSRFSVTSFTDLLRLRSPGLPLLSSSVWFSATVLGEMLCILTHWLLGEMLRSPQYFSCSLYFYSTSNCFPPTKWLLLPWS